MPYNSPMKKKGSSCMQMKDHKGKPSGLMMEGSVNHMSMLHKETDKQEAQNLLDDTPVQDKASAMEMSPYKMGHESPAKMSHKGSPMHDNHNKDERSGKGKSITEGIELGEATVSLSDMYKKDSELNVRDFPRLRESLTQPGMFQVEGSPTGSNAYLGRGSFLEGDVGSWYTSEQVNKAKNTHQGLVNRKNKAKKYLAANK